MSRKDREELSIAGGSVLTRGGRRSRLVARGLLLASALVLAGALLWTWSLHGEALRRLWGGPSSAEGGLRSAMPAEALPEVPPPPGVRSAFPLRHDVRAGGGLYTSATPPGEVVAFYRERLADGGWNEAPARADPYPEDEPFGKMRRLHFVRRGARCVLTVEADGAGSAVVVQVLAGPGPESGTD